MEKVGLVLEGGGMRGIYTGGVLDVFTAENLCVPYIIGVSAGACNATSYISRQAGRAGRVLLNNFMNPRYLSIRNLLLRGSIFGMDFLFDEIPRRIDPFDFSAFRESKVEFEVPVTNLLTGQADYYKKPDLSDDRLTLLRATCSMPLVSKIVTYHGTPYLDGAVADSIPIARALKQGCTRLIVVLTRPRGYHKPPMRYHALRCAVYHPYPAFVQATDTRHKRYNDALRLLECLEREGRALVLCPERPITFSALERNPEKMHRLYQDGIADARRATDQIRAFCAEGCAKQAEC